MSLTLSPSLPLSLPLPPSPPSLALSLARSLSPSLSLSLPLSLSLSLPLSLALSIDDALPESYSLTTQPQRSTHCYYVDTIAISDLMCCVCWQDLHNVVGLAVDIREDILFYSDVARNNESIGRVNLHNSSTRIIVTGMKSGTPVYEDGVKGREGEWKEMSGEVETMGMVACV